MTFKELFIVLTSCDKEQKADAVILLEGDGFNRIAEACALIKRDLGEVLVFSGGITNVSYGSFPYEKCLPFILKEGIHEKQLLHEAKSSNTREQAENIIALCIEKQWTKIILLASHYHQYRAFLTFLKVLSEKGMDRSIEIINLFAKPAWFEDNGWGKPIDLLKIEFEKIEEYKNLGHISEYEDAVLYYQWRITK